MNTYIGMVVVQAKPAVMVNGCIWPEGLPIPTADPEPKLGSPCMSVKLNDEVTEGYVFIGDNKYPEFMEKEKFDKRFQSAKAISFSIALDALKRGGRIAREGWNGKGMYVFLADDLEFRTEADISECYDKEDGVEVSEVMILRTAQGTFQPGWLATQSDILANDWYVLE